MSTSDHSGGLPAGLACAKSEDVLQSQLDDTRIHARRSDLSEVARREIWQGINCALTVIRISELGVVQGVEEFGSELEHPSFRKPEVFEET